MEFDLKKRLHLMKLNFDAAAVVVDDDVGVNLTGVFVVAAAVAVFEFGINLLIITRFIYLF